MYEHLAESTVWFESKPTLSVGYVGAYLDDGLHQPVSTCNLVFGDPLRPPSCVCLKHKNTERGSRGLSPCSKALEDSIRSQVHACAIT